MNLLKTLAKISGMTTISRILGFVRDTVTAQMFGSNVATDAFFVAFKLPNLLRRIFAEGAFSQAFVPILAEYKNTQGQDETVDFARYRMENKPADRTIGQQLAREVELLFHHRGGYRPALVSELPHVESEQDVLVGADVVAAALHVVKPWGHTPRNHCKTRLRARTLPPRASPAAPASGSTKRYIHPPPHLQRSDLPTKFCA